MLQVDKLKSYASEKNARKAIESKFPTANYMVVFNSKGRAVILVPYGANQHIPVGALIHNGFAVIG